MSASGAAMNREETIALFDRCEAARAKALAEGLAAGNKWHVADDAAHEAAKAVWNGWAKAMLAERHALEAAGKFEILDNILNTSYSQEALNEVTRAWMDAASADFSNYIFRVNPLADQQVPSSNVKSVCVADDIIQFEGFIFPGEARFTGATFSGDASFAEALFWGDAGFEGAQFSGKAVFAGARFLSRARFGRVQISGDAQFGDAQFYRGTWFEKAQFSGTAMFAGAGFSGAAEFGMAQFSSMAWFKMAEFSSAVEFHNAVFKGDAEFRQTKFSGDARFEGVQFSGVAAFTRAQFSSAVEFRNAVFRGDAEFRHVQFPGNAGFEGATFFSIAGFQDAQFSDDARFETATFSGDAEFRHVQFSGNAEFQGVTFTGDANFRSASFGSNTSFKTSKFGGIAAFENARIDGSSDFASSRFATPPEFSSDFMRTMSLDNVVIEIPSLFWGLFKEVDRNIATRFRRYKAVAIKDNDNFSEHEYFVGELVGRILCHHERCSLIAVLGVFYEFFSNFGRSVWRPLLGLLATIVIAATFFLSQRDVVQKLDAGLRVEGASVTSAFIQSTAYAWQEPQPCFTRPEPPQAEASLSRRGGLVEEVRNMTNSRVEALHLALRNSLIVLDSSGDAAHRTYGCLYGVELYGGNNPIAVVPSAVSTATGIQKVFSAMFLFLFGLGLRNMLKMK